LARVIYLGETKALERPWPAPRTGADELAAGADPSAKRRGQETGCSNGATVIQANLQRVALLSAFLSALLRPPFF
jgi:hypothetical protein